MTRRAITFAVGALLTAGACADDTAPGGARGEAAPTPSTPPAAGTPAPGAQPVDPRRGGFAVGFGEFAVTLEAPAIRPGKVTFVVRNGGQLVHGFEIESESENGDSSGPGGDDDRFKFETPTFGPGRTIDVPLDLAPGLYKIYCYVADHEERGMQALLEVRPDAPLVREEGGDGPGRGRDHGLRVRPAGGPGCRRHARHVGERRSDGAHGDGRRRVVRV